MYSSVAKRLKFHKTAGAALLVVMEISCVISVLRRGIHGFEVAILPLCMAIIFGLWVLLAKLWVRSQFGPLYTMAVNVTEEDSDKRIDRLKEWMESHKNIYDPTFMEEYRIGNEDTLNSIRKKISLIHIPLILIDGVPDESFMKMAKEMGVMIHYIGRGGKRLPKDFKRAGRLKGLYVWSVS